MPPFKALAPRHQLRWRQRHVRTFAALVMLAVGSAFALFLVVLLLSTSVAAGLPASWDFPILMEACAVTSAICIFTFFSPALLLLRRGAGLAFFLGFISACLGIVGAGSFNLLILTWTSRPPTSDLGSPLSAAAAIYQGAIGSFLVTGLIAFMPQVIAGFIGVEIWRATRP